MPERLIPKGYRLRTRVTRDPFQLMSRRGYKWFGVLPVEFGDEEVLLWMTGSISQWFNPGDEVEIVLYDEPKKFKGALILGPRDYELHRIWDGDRVPVWPPWRKEYILERRDALHTKRVYEYRVVAREAETEGTISRL